jgi:NAD(P)-dependent dehydrogenase (short-subunit alcohol dehydrogenase family)
VVDVADREAVFALAEDIKTAHGRCEMVFNNAGVACSLAFDQAEMKQIDKVLNINMHGVINVAKAFLPLLKESERGALVNTSSILGLVSFPSSSSYCISKYAVTALSQCLALDSAELYPHVHVCSVHPGFIPTAIVMNSKEHMLVKARAGRKIEISDVDKFFRFIGSTEPQVVAKTMVEGMRRRQHRILIGTDAKIMDIVVRIFPGILYMRKTYMAFIAFTLISVRLIGKRTLAALALLTLYFHSARLKSIVSKLSTILSG